MTEFRVLLEGGDVLVVDIHVEEAGEPEPVDPTSFGESLLNALGLSTRRGQRLEQRPSKGKSMKHIVRPVEEDPDEWLARTSKQSLKGM